MSTIPTTNTIVPNLPLPPVIDYTSRDYSSILNDLINAIPQYMPEWTDRSPGDFGMVMIELFSYLGDTLNYYIDRVANESFLATAQQRSSILFLAQLLDYQPSDPVAAATILQFNIQTPSPSPIVIPAQTQVTTRQIQGSVVTFETDHDLTIWGDNTVPTVVTQISTGTASQAVPIPGPWDGATHVVTVGGVTWTYVPTLAGQAPTATVYTVSTTLVSGVLIPTGILFGNGVNGGIPTISQVILVTYFPVSGSQYTGSVTATQGTTIIGEDLGNSDGNADQVFNLFQTPVINGSVNILINEGFGFNDWNLFRRLIDASPTDRAFTTVTNANGVVAVRFGDGSNGLIPAPGSAILATYRVGGGVAGNVSANSLSTMSTSLQGVLTVNNPSSASGGADAESIDHIRTHAPLSLTAINRAVTLQDYAALVLVNSDVAKASASGLSNSAVTVYVHPAGTFISDQVDALNHPLHDRVQAIKKEMTNVQGTGYLDNKIMAGTTVTIMGPQYNKNGVLQLGYVPIDISVSVFVLPNYQQKAVKAAVSAALSNLLSFNNVDFGSRISLLSVYMAMDAVPGVAYGAVQILTRDEVAANPLAPQQDIQCLSYEIPWINPLYNSGQPLVSVTGGIF